MTAVASLNQSRTLDPRGVPYRVEPATVGRTTVWLAICSCPADCGRAFVGPSKAAVMARVSRGG